MAKYGYVGSTPTGDGKVSAFKAGRNYVVTFFFEVKYADKEMELNGVRSTDIKHMSKIVEIIFAWNLVRRFVIKK